jgi:hypothetical protein
MVAFCSMFLRRVLDSNPLRLSRLENKLIFDCQQDGTATLSFAAT